MNTYHVFYNGKQIEIQAVSSYQAQLQGIANFSVPKSKKHMVHAHIVAGADGKEIIHIADF